MKSIEDKLSLAIGTSTAQYGKVNSVFVKGFLMGHTIGKYRRDITEQEMEYINSLPNTVYQLIKMEDVTKNVNLTLTMGIVKILHNACVDVLKQEPTLTAYKAALEELQEVIDNHDKMVRGDIVLPIAAQIKAAQFAIK